MKRPGSVSSSFAAQNPPVLQPVTDQRAVSALTLYFFSAASGTSFCSQVRASGPPSTSVHSVSRGGSIINGGKTATNGFTRPLAISCEATAPKSKCLNMVCTCEGWPGSTIRTGNFVSANRLSSYSGGSHINTSAFAPDGPPRTTIFSIRPSPLVTSPYVLTLGGLSMPTPVRSVQEV